MPFVIESSHTLYSKKLQRDVTYYSYFREHRNLVAPMNCMEGDWQKAKHYETITEARRDKRKYFSRTKGVKVIMFDKGIHLTDLEGKLP